MAESSRIEELRRRVHLDPASIAFAVLAEEYRRAGRYDEAITTCTIGLQRHPAYLSAHVTLGRALIEIGQHDDARDEFELVLGAAPENLAAIRGLAEIHQRLGLMPELYETDQSSAADHASVDAPPPSASPIFAAGSGLSLASAVPDPALAGLESFLAAISRARGADHSVRG